MPTLIHISLLLTLVITLGACSAKEVNEGVDSITNDITNAFEESRDKSAD